MTEIEAWAAQLPPHEGSKSMVNIDTSTEAVERLLEDVTPGPWEWAAIYCGDVHHLVHWVEGETFPSGDRRYIQIHSDGSAGGEYNPDIDVDGPNGRFIATARELVPALLAERDRLMKERDEARAQLARREEMHDCAMEERDDATLYSDEQKARVKVLEEAGNRLSFMAQTSGGTAGRDDGLMAAIDGWTAALAASIPADPALTRPKNEKSDD